MAPKAAARPTPPVLPDSFFRSQAWRQATRALGLAPREAEVMECLLRMLDDETAVADRLGISPHTVHTYFERLYRKLDVRSRSQAVARFFAMYATMSPPPPPRLTPEDAALRAQRHHTLLAFVSPDQATPR